MKNGNLVLKGRNIYLRLLEEEDASQEYCNWINNPTVNKYLMTKKTTVEELKKYIRERKENENCLFWGIFLKVADKHIGNIKLEPIDWKKKNATMGLIIGDKSCWGQGLCVDAEKTLIKNAFGKLKINKIDGAVHSHNRGAIVCNLQAGLRIDSCIPWVVKKGKTLYYSINMSIKKE